MFVRNLKLALVVIIGGVVFGLVFFASRDIAQAIPTFDLIITPEKIKPGETVKFKIELNEPTVTLFKVYIYKVREDGETDTPPIFQQDIIQTASLDYDFTPDSDLFKTDKYLVIIQPYISQTKPLVIYQSSFVYFTIIEPFAQQPVLFIHGLGGTPDSWQSGERNYFQLLQDAGYPSTHLLSYGYAGRHRDNGGYNYDGAVEDIAKDMEQTIATLSAQSQDGKVDIVAYSLGNLVARYYLATHKNNHKVDQVISIAGPNKGSYVMDINKGVEEIPGIGKWAEFGIRNAVISLAAIAGNKWHLDSQSPSAQQLFSTSNFLTWLNMAVNTPTDVRFYPLYGDIHATFKRKLFHWEIKKEKDIGDGVILAESASEIAGANNPQKTAYKENSELVSKLVMNADGSWKVDWLGTDNMRYFHTRILEQQELKDKVKQILMND